ncbi:hypothetical protein SeMB42_g07662 [Synchytrium endobioticum]|uniref:RING-type domain-containing protein n=1 Tax=Synchytrium endobioticum TaxID=286115 RepID=A0A507C1R2_9FUNG|nr:hypothetical protein SeMB42_g07662 [Synchytrium endobioticum]TPX46695.1 hypothetical protein SeLEV6574_g03087 [Synchytrium endobioticum]
MRSNPHMPTKQRKQILAFVVFHLMACAFNPALAMDRRDIVRSGSAGRRGSRGHHGGMESSYNGMTSDAVGHGGIMGGSSGIGGMDERHDMGSSQYAASSSSSRHDVSLPPPMDLATFVGVLEEIEGLCDAWGEHFASLAVNDVLQDDFLHIAEVCEGIIVQGSESDIQKYMATILEMLRPVLDRIEELMSLRVQYVVKSDFKKVVCLLEGREPDARPQLLKSNRVVARRYSDVLILIKRMFTKIDSLPSQSLPRPAQAVLDSLRDEWNANDDIIGGIEIVWSGLEGLLRLGGTDARPFYRYSASLRDILLRTYRWLEANSVGENPWQNLNPSESPIRQGPSGSSAFQDLCAICLAAMDPEMDSENKVLPCDHLFHKNCIDQWLDRSDTCPLCRKIWW